MSVQDVYMRLCEMMAALLCVRASIVCVTIDGEDLMFKMEVSSRLTLQRVLCSEHHQCLPNPCLPGVKVDPEQKNSVR